MEQKEIAQAVDEYFAHFPPDIQERLKDLRKIIKKAAPDAEETLSYRMPAYILKGTLVYFAGYSNHIGFYPLPSAMIAFKEELTPFKTSKGSIQFPNDKPLPKKLISEIVKFRVMENLEKAELKNNRIRKK